MAAGETIVLKEIHGGRSVEFQQVGDFMVLETGASCYAFDVALFTHAMKRALQISVILEHESLEGDYGLP